MKNKILVLGSNGQLGKAIKKSLLSESTKENFIFFSKKNIDITDSEKLTSLFRQYKFDYLINCAAYTNVELAESNLDSADRINANGAKHLATTCKKFDCILIHISTDYIFNGKSNKPYIESDIPKPINNYGLSKLNGENYIKQILSRYFIIRTSWLYSEFNSNFMIKMLDLAQKKQELDIVKDEVSSPTYAGDLSKFILHLIKSKSLQFGTYNYSNSGRASRYDFANEIFKLSNLKVKTNPILAENFKTKAKRPSFSALDLNKTKKTFNINFPNWKHSLRIASTNYFMNKNLNIAIRAALEAGKVIMEVYNKPINVELKDDKSPLTEADTKANTIINSFLTSTKIPIISEENKQIKYEDRQNWNTCWIVDPVDGTKEFIKRNGEFTVNIALVKEGKPQLGVIYVPASKTLYYANVIEQLACKAVLQTHDTLIDEIESISKILKPKENEVSALQIVGSRSHMNQETLDYVEKLRGKGKQIEIVSKGSSLKFCLVAEGNADIYPRFAPTMEWDTAAGQAICNAVGVEVISQETKRPLRYNKENLLNPWFLVAKK